jgi:hypothetical protein
MFRKLRQNQNETGWNSNGIGFFATQLCEIFELMRGFRYLTMANN